MSKVHQLAIDHDLVETKSPKKDQQAKNDKMIKKAELDQLLTTLKGQEVSKEQEDRWTETLKAELNVPCPCKVPVCLHCNHKVGQSFNDF